MKTFNPSLILLPALYLILAIVSHLAINEWTGWPAPYKYVLPAAFAIVAVIDFFVRLNAPAAAPTSAPATPKPKTPNKPSSLETFTFELAAWGIILLLCVAGFSKLSDFFAANAQQAIASGRETRVIHAFPIDHSYRQRKELTRKLWFDPGKTYDLFELKNGQKWEWYFDHDIEFRIKVTGQEPFIPLSRHPYSGQEPTADRAGLLQVRTKSKHNRVEAYRLREYFTD